MSATLERLTITENPKPPEQQETPQPAEAPPAEDTTMAMAQARWAGAPEATPVVRASEYHGVLCSCCSCGRAEMVSRGRFY